MADTPEQHQQEIELMCGANKHKMYIRCQKIPVLPFAIPP